MITKFRLGADPEMFLIDNISNKVVSAINKVPGTKISPYKISADGHSVQVDNVLLEFNIPPSGNPKRMWKDIEFVKDWFNDNLPKNHSYLIKSSAKLDKSELEDEGANEFGCDPDFNAWTGKVNKPPEAKDTLWRSAGAHIHISYEGYNMGTSVALVKAMDLFLGVPSVIFDTDTERRKLYGKAGAFRFKNYPNGEGGVEYRVLSNFWIKKLDYVKWVFSQVEKAFIFINEHGEIENGSELANSIIHVINNSDVAEATKLIKKYKIYDTEQI